VKGALVYRCFQLQQIIARELCSQLMRGVGWLWGVEFSGPAHFYGTARFIRHPAGRIVLGRDLVFRSAPSSNTIGLNRRCFFSAGAGATLQVGDGCGFSGTVIAAQQQITLGQRVMCGANVTITDTDRHPTDALARQRGEPGASAAVDIADDVWLGMNVVVLKGVRIGAGAVIAANSVVVSDIPSGCLAGGQPAKVLRQL
jgi:hypothetical protein